MKKTFPVNIDGAVFYIDEDAYNLLNTYVDQLRKAFPGADGAETVDGIESRISEIVTERVTASHRVITIADINDIINMMGRPDDIAGSTGDDDDSTGDGDSDSTGKSAGTPPPYTAPAAASRRLYRDEGNKVFGGVFAGLAWYTGWNVNIMRLFYVLLAVFTYVWPVTLIYLVAWMIIPAATTPRQILEMTGRPVTVGNVGQTVLGGATASPAGSGQWQAPSGSGSGSIFSTFFSVVGKVIMAGLAVFGGVIGLGMVCMFACAVAGIIIYCGWGDSMLLNGFSSIRAASPVLGGAGMICLSLAVLIPCLGAVWGGLRALFNVRWASRSTVITLVTLTVLLAIAAIVLLHVANIQHVGFAVAAASSAFSSVVTV